MDVSWDDEVPRTILGVTVTSTLTSDLVSRLGIKCGLIFFICSLVKKIIFPVPTHSCKSIFCDLALLTIHMFDVNCIHITHVRHKPAVNGVKLQIKAVLKDLRFILVRSRYSAILF